MVLKDVIILMDRVERKPDVAACERQRRRLASLALESQNSINKLKAPSAYQQSSKCMKTSKKNQFYKDSVRFYKYK